jgi:transcription elongation factor Elf1
MAANDQFAHVLLFSCPKCGRPLASTCTNQGLNLEEADAHWFASHCHCGWSGEVIGVTAVRHWVEPWSGKAPNSGRGSECS